MLAIKHACRYRNNVGSVGLHAMGNGKPTRKTCRYCKGPIDTESGMWGVFAWTGNGRYPREAAHATFNREPAADEWARQASPDYVVRWIPEV